LTRYLITLLAQERYKNFRRQNRTSLKQNDGYLIPYSKNVKDWITITLWYK